MRLLGPSGGGGEGGGSSGKFLHGHPEDEIDVHLDGDAIFGQHTLRASAILYAQIDDTAHPFVRPQPIYPTPTIRENPEPRSSKTALASATESQAGPPIIWAVLSESSDSSSPLWT